MVVPLHHPVRIVENAAFVDILSNGRFQLGLGSGYRPTNLKGSGLTTKNGEKYSKQSRLS